MRKMIMGMITVAVMTLSLAAWAADEQTTEQKDGSAVKQTPTRSNPSRQILNIDPNELAARREIRGRGPAQDPAVRGAQGQGVQEMYQNAMQRRQQQHEEGIKELEELKKLAESENATKTVAAIQKMIDKRNEEFKKQTEEADRRSAEFREMLKQRQQQGTTGQGQGQGQTRPGRTKQGTQDTTTPATENKAKTDSTTKTETTTK